MDWDFNRPPSWARNCSVHAGVTPYSGSRSISWRESLRRGSRSTWRSERRKPSVNHWAKYANSTVDFGHGVPSPVRVKRSATFASSGRSRAATGGRWRLEYVRSVSEDHEVYGASVLSGFGRVGIVSTAELISAWLVKRRSRGRACRNSQAGSKLVRASNWSWFFQPSRARLRVTS